MLRKEAHTVNNYGAFLCALRQYVASQQHVSWGFLAYLASLNRHRIKSWLWLTNVSDYRLRCYAVCGVKIRKRVTDDAQCVCPMRMISRYGQTRQRNVVLFLPVPVPNENSTSSCS
ncbi:hypothetical protein AGJ32_13020 [Cronobacter turicensis]|nr:hypothetical protein [Cronobacter turicensis]EGT5741034.1 hypothetical protein [Cronobacter turicensis]